MTSSGAGGNFVLGNLSLEGIRGVTLGGITLPATILRAPAVTSVIRTGNQLTITIPGSAGYSYQLEQAASLNVAVWQSIGAIQNGTGAPLAFTGSIGTTKTFFRVRMTKIH